MYCMPFTGDRGKWAGEVSEKLRSGLEALERTFSCCLLVSTVAVVTVEAPVTAVGILSGGSGEAAVTVVIGGEEGADLDVLPKNLRPELSLA